MAALLIFAVLLIGGAAAVAVVLVLAAGRAAAKVERRRKDAFYAWTMANGWQMREGDVPAAWRQRLSHLSRFRVRRLAHATVRGLPVTAADCHYTAHSTDGPRAARALLSPALVDAHLRGHVPQWSIQGGELLITETGRLTPEGVLPGAERVVWLAGMLGYRG